MSTAETSVNMGSGPATEQEVQECYLVEAGPGKYRLVVTVGNVRTASTPTVYGAVAQVMLDGQVCAIHAGLDDVGAVEVSDVAIMAENGEESMIESDAVNVVDKDADAELAIDEDDDEDDDDDDEDEDEDPESGGDDDDDDDDSDSGTGTPVAA